LKVINLGILAHVDAGKTTVAEQLLYLSGAIRSPGSVDKGSAQTDPLPIERERGISVRTSSVSVTCGDVRINIVDTPGHMDFIAEVERAVAALDAVLLVVSAVEGIQSQTSIFWKAVQKLQIPAVILINKIDRMGCEPELLTETLKEKFSPYIFPVNRPTGHGGPDAAVAARSFADFTEDELLSLGELDEAMAGLVLSGGGIPDRSVGECLRRLARAGKCYPLLYGAAIAGVGMEQLLAALTEYLPTREITEEGDLSGIVYKVEHDPGMGKIAHVRLFSGCVRNRDMLPVVRGVNEPFHEKVTQIRTVEGAKRQDAGILLGGDIGALCGMSKVKAGDVIGESLLRQGYQMANPLFSVRILGESQRQNELLHAIAQLSDEDPLLDFEWLDEEKELIIKVMGTVQLEVLKYLLMERYRLDIDFSPATVIYKETPTRSGTGFEAYTMPKPCWAVIELLIEPLPRGTGYRFHSVVNNNDIFYRYQRHIEQCVPEALKQGLKGWETVDLSVTLIGGQHHTIHTHPLDFFLATPMAVMNGLVNCGTTLLEPIVKMELSADESLSGRLISDIINMRGEFDSPVIADGTVAIEARVPVATSVDYAVRLASLTSGKGRIRTEFEGYRECPPELGAVKKRNGINPLDRAKWILHKRSVL